MTIKITIYMGKKYSSAIFHPVTVSSMEYSGHVSCEAA